jgi:hypothetical protein
MMNEYGKSDSSIVPGKSPNKVLGGTAETMEEREMAKGNLFERNAPGRRAGAVARQVRLSGYVGQQGGASSFSLEMPWRHHPRQEPYEVIPHVRIRAGGAGQLASLPRPIPYECPARSGTQRKTCFPRWDELKCFKPLKGSS